MEIFWSLGPDAGFTGVATVSEGVCDGDSSPVADRSIVPLGAGDWSPASLSSLRKSRLAQPSTEMFGIVGSLRVECRS